MPQVRPPNYDVTIYAPLSAPMYVGVPAVGGAERQMVILARSLAALGLRVCHVVEYAEGLPDTQDGVRILSESPRIDGQSYWRRFRQVMAPLLAADARVYIQRNTGLGTLFVGALARWRRRAFIYSVSSPQGLTGRDGLSLKEWVGFRLGLLCAQVVVVQTAEQSSLYEPRHQSLVHIPSFAVPAPSLARTDDAKPGVATRDVFLWVGRPASYKDPMALVNLARAVPEARFLMVGIDTSSSAVPADLAAAAAATDNLSLLPPMRHHELASLYQRAVAVINTSEFEGFPNTLLEGWAHGALALTLRVDPDGAIARHGLGVCANGSASELAQATRQMWQARREPDPRREDAVRYVAQNHSPEVIAERWHDLLKRVSRSDIREAATRRGAEEESSAPPLAFVVCPSYHGATLLALLLNNHPMITALGDTNPTRMMDQICACGRPVSQCPFWDEIRNAVATDRFSHLHYLLPILPSPFENRPLEGGLVNVSGNALVNRVAGRVADLAADAVLPAAWHVRSTVVDEYIETWERFYRTLRQLHGTSLVVDGSKTTRKVRLMTLGRAGRQDVRVIHLVRDPRAFVASARRVDPSAEPRAQAWLWSDQHREIEKLSTSVPYLRVRYEDLATDPESEMEAIFDFLGVPQEAVVMAPRFAEKHHLMGNKMLFSFTGEVRLDERWRRELTSAEQQSVIRHAASLTARYGYA